MEVRKVSTRELENEYELALDCIDGNNDKCYEYLYVTDILFLDRLYYVITEIGEHTITLGVCNKNEEVTIKLNYLIGKNIQSLTRNNYV